MFCVHRSCAPPQHSDRHRLRSILAVTPVFHAICVNLDDLSMSIMQTGNKFYSCATKWYSLHYTFCLNRARRNANRRALIRHCKITPFRRSLAHSHRVWATIGRLLSFSIGKQLSQFNWRHVCVGFGTVREQFV